MSDSTEITVPGLDTLVAKRVLKSGKTATRGAIDIAISGNKQEREGLSFALADDFWFNKANVYPFVQSLNRVFPTLVKTVEARNATVRQINAENPAGQHLKEVNLKAPTKLDVLAMFGVARNLTGADKGAKAQVIAVMQHIADGEDIRAQDKAARAAAYALKAASSTSSLATLGQAEFA